MPSESIRSSSSPTRTFSMPESRAPVLVLGCPNSTNGGLSISTLRLVGVWRS